MGKTVLCIALLASGVSWAQEFNVYSSTFAQYYKQDIPGLKEGAYAPFTQFLGLDATNLGLENLSMHIFGWANFDLADQSRVDGKTTGSLTYGYVRYRFEQANGEIQAGRFAINHGLGYEQIDGVSGRVDLKGGFAVSAFGGRPVYHKVENPDQQYDYEYQRDIIFGTRLSYRIVKMGEAAISFVQDGTPTSYAAKNRFSYQRKLIGGDIILVPIAALMFSGRTVFDIADRDGMTREAFDLQNASRIAENDYSLSYRFSSKFTARANYAERNFHAYYNGSNFPSLFSTYEKDKHRSYSCSATYVKSGSCEITADYRHIYRETFGSADRFGADFRWKIEAKKLAGGLGYHRVSTSEVKFIDPLRPSYSLSHHELRAWAMYSSDNFTGNLDGIIHKFDDDASPLNGRSALYELVASGGYKPSEKLHVSTGLAFCATGMAKSEARVLVRLDYKFGFTVKGGK
jgi:hypothetical protein